MHGAFFPITCRMKSVSRAGLNHCQAAGMPIQFTYPKGMGS